MPADRIGRVLCALLWLCVPAAGLVPAVVEHVAPSHTWPRLAMICLFFLLAGLRTGVEAVRRPGARTLPLIMLAALALFGTGSLTLATNPSLGFPSVAEVPFGGAYLCFTAFLVLDTPGRTAWHLRRLLEIGVVAGGIVSAVVFVLVTPLAANPDVDELSLLVALVYPLCDVVLLVIALTQLATRYRTLDRRNGLLLCGLLVLGLIDASLALGLASGGYAFSTVKDVVWAAALAALAESALLAKHRFVSSRPGLAAPMAAASGLCGLLVLAVPSNGHAALTRWPAVLTLALSLGLLLVSLRDARSVTEATRLSHTDDLTGLANRRAAVQRLGASSAEACALLLLDLNGFKSVNDAFGHPEGDRLLVRVAQRLREAVPEADLVARLGGDEFAVICAPARHDEVNVRAEAILDAMREPLVVADLGLTVSVAIGIAARSASDSDGVGDLLRRADVAMYRAKSTPGGAYCWYDPSTDEFAEDRLHLVEELRAGIQGGQLRPYFQPQVSATGRELVGVEALVRWQHPTRGLLAPAEFLASARTAGLMLPLSLEMVRLCVRQAAAWAESGRPLRMSLNVDPPELLSGAWGPALVGEIERTGVDPSLFTVELTEELLVVDPAGAAQRIRELARHGIELSIDDYGTGYSGLAWLQTLPVRELKLAREFVSQVLTDERTRTIVTSTVRLATQLDLRVVAEGVEDDRTAAVVTGMGVALLQGYLISRPLGAASLDAWREIEQPTGRCSASAEAR